MALSKFSFDALQAPFANWPTKNIRALARRIIHERFGKLRTLNSASIETLQTFYGFVSVNAHQELRLRLPTVADPVLIVRGHFSNWGAAGLSCLFVALGWDFATLAANAQDSAAPRASRPARRSTDDARIAHAKQALEMDSGHPLSWRHHNSVLILKTLNPSWLRKRFGWSEEDVAIPSIEEDRTYISSHRDSHRWRSSADYLDATFRARTRDKEWFKVAFEKPEKKVTSKSKQEKTSQIPWFENALELVLAQQEMPGCVSVTSIALAAGATVTRTQHVINSNPAIKAALDATNKEWVERRIRWQLDRMIEQGIHLRGLQLLRILKLDRQQSARHLLNKICSENAHWAAHVIPIANLTSEEDS